MNRKAKIVSSICFWFGKDHFYVWHGIARFPIRSITLTPSPSQTIIMIKNHEKKFFVNRKAKIVSSICFWFGKDHFYVWHGIARFPIRSITLTPSPSQTIIMIKNHEKKFFVNRKAKIVSSICFWFGKDHFYVWHGIARFPIRSITLTPSPSQTIIMIKNHEKFFVNRKAKIVSSICFWFGKDHFYVWHGIARFPIRSITLTPSPSQTIIMIKNHEKKFL